MSSIVETVISIYRRGELKTIERYKARISATEDSTKQSIDNFKKLLADFLGLKEQARGKLGLGSKLYRLLKGNGKTENYSILTRVSLKPGPRRPNGPVAQCGFSTIFLSSGKSTRKHRSASGLGVKN